MQKGNILNIKEAYSNLDKKQKEISITERIEIMKISVEIFSKFKTNLNTKNNPKEEIEDIYLWLQNIFNKNKEIPPYRKENLNLKDTYSDDYIFCLEKGCIEHKKKFKTLTKHLNSYHKMSFKEYRDKWNLDINYPSVCKNYSNLRQEIAKK